MCKILVTGKSLKASCRESINIDCLAMFKSLTKKHRTINHILIIQSVRFTSVAIETFVEAYLCFLVSTSATKLQCFA